MILTLYTEEFFSAAHHLKGYKGKCSNLHGHTWKISVWVKGDEAQKDNTGILWDFNNLKKLVDMLDHKHLNDVIDINPSVENISSFIYRKLKEDFPNIGFKVRVYESLLKRKSYCETGDF